MLMVLGLLPVIIEATVVEYDWIVDYMSTSSDCVKNLCLSINQQFSSPTIHAVEGDTLVVRITNVIPTEGVVLHWHGIHQVGILCTSSSSRFREAGLLCFF